MPEENSDIPNKAESLSFDEREKLEWELAELAADIDEIEDNKESLEIVIRQRYELLEDMPEYEQTTIREELVLLEGSFAKLVRKSLELKNQHEAVLKKLGIGYDPDNIAR